jgi:hypothetical protein
VSIEVCDTRRGDDLSKRLAGESHLLADVAGPLVMVDAIGVDWSPHAPELDAAFLAGRPPEPFMADVLPIAGEHGRGRSAARACRGTSSLSQSGLSHAR